MQQNTEFAPYETFQALKPEEGIRTTVKYAKKVKNVVSGDLGAHQTQTALTTTEGIRRKLHQPQESMRIQNSLRILNEQLPPV
jgi:hypothetical protein